MTTVMPFADDTAFGHLDNEGYVFTYRKNRRSEPNGDVWVNRGRGTSGVFYGECREVEREVPPAKDVLNPYASESGFGTSDEWRAAIHELNGELPETGFIYRVDKGEPMHEERDR